MTENQWFIVCETYLKTIESGKSCWFACDGSMCAFCPYWQNSIGCESELTIRQWKYEFKQWMKDHPVPRISVKLTSQQLCELENSTDVIADIMDQSAHKRDILRRVNEILNDDSITIDDAYGGEE